MLKMFRCHFNQENGLHLVIVCVRFQVFVLKRVEMLLTVVLLDIKRQFFFFCAQNRIYIQLIKFSRRKESRVK